MTLLQMPLIGLGTWKMGGEACTRAVQSALEIGYRHIDTAHVYENHRAVGEGIRGWKREELFITSKFTLDDERPPLQALEEALSDLGIDYLDLYLVHWPNRSRDVTAALKALTPAVTEGKVLHVGVSNFTVHHLQDLFDAGFSSSANQVEFHPYLNQDALLQFCAGHGVRLIAYRSLGGGDLVKDPLFVEIGERHQKTAAQVILRWLVQKQIPVIPKASSKKHLRENFEIFDFALSSEEMKALEAVNKELRFCSPEWADFGY